jgi:N-acyl-D-amino-acid deacylase
MFDLLIRDAEIIDGSGQPAYRADLAIGGERIAAIGHFKGRVKREIRASGLTLAPGFIDPHSHADLILPLPPERQMSLMRCKLAQGVTTTIIGNCGLGCAPVMSPEAEGALRAINAWMTPESFPWNWRSTGEYLDRLETNGLPLNIAALIPHGPVRISSMGLSKGAPTKRELRYMRTLIEEGLSAGALGLSTGLIYPPGMYSDADELKQLARVVAEFEGIYTSHIRGSSELLLPAVKELLDIGRETGVRIHHSHNEAVGRDHWSKIDSVLRLEEEAEREGVRVSFDMFPYTAAATMMLAIYPPWALEGGVQALLDRLRQPRLRNRIRRDIERKAPRWPPWREGGWPHNLVRAAGWEAIRIGYIDSDRNKAFENHSLAEIGRMVGKTPFDAVSDLMIEEMGRISMLIFEVTGEREARESLAEYARHRLCAFCTDAEDFGRGVPHPSAYGAFARILSKFVREDGILSLEEAIRKMTAYPAQIFGLKDRGVIRPGAFADLILFDPGKIDDRASYERPRREPSGLKTVLLNGSIAFDAGIVTAGDRGKLLRKTLGTHAS